MLASIEQNMSELAPYRKPELFNEFLVKGYTAITLSSVSEEKFSDLLQTKICLGTLITLYDDFADRPSQSNPFLLESLYQLDFKTHSLASENHVIDFAKSLFENMHKILSCQPHYNQLIEILNFDLKQFYSTNQYSSLVTANPFINNQTENRHYTHHNMGMIIAGMMDLMASEKIQHSEFGAIREVLFLGQRMGRIFNVLVTRQREALDGDITGELAALKSEEEIALAVHKLRQEICVLHKKIQSFETQITTFSVKSYLEGLIKVQKLHEKMEGII
ncbi:hypothetical protein [Pseudobdellovibrio sp. HCB154]|uniref:hypothetical protein n=1 Tax=Pseudobdellovibrio sp. HCB154 TaxID=3386277 RepID=UPI00391758D0